jgi:hypothetical protein
MAADSKQEMMAWSYPQLFERFESDIIYDAHSFWIRFSRSWSRQELERRGKDALQEIVRYLRAAHFSKDGQMELAWSSLLNNLEIKIDPKKTGPTSLSDFAGWLKWAEKFAPAESDFSVEKKRLMCIDGKKKCVPEGSPQCAGCGG